MAWLHPGGCAWAEAGLMADWVIVAPAGELRAAAPADGPFQTGGPRP